LIEQLGCFYAPAGAALRATFIVDPENVIQHVTVNNLNVGRSPEETLRVLDAHYKLANYVLVTVQLAAKHFNGN
jgi:alkyl hydroperoxide reductase subunit AhpC